MKILVTGHTGYIGRQVCEELIHMGHTPIRCDFRFENTPKKNLFKAYGNPDKLIHCAWSGLPNYTSINHYNNVPGQYRFIEHLVDCGLKDVTVLGSCLETIDIQTHYALAKRLLRQKLEELPINLKWAQLFYVYGGNDKPYKLIPQIRKVIERGEKTFSIIDAERDFIHVKNAVQAICDIALQTDVTGRIEVGSGQAVPVIDFAKRYFHEIEFVKDYPANDYEPFSYFCNLQKLNTI
jgi:dTDP-6-deoxy-L-talose 4-dehydrogenase (NAD+)